MCGAVVGRQRRDFYLFVAPFLTDDDRERFRGVSGRQIERALGPELCAALTKRLQTDAGFRSEVLSEVRCAAWWIRNARFSGRPRPVAEASFFWEAIHLLHAAGATAEDLTALVHCSLEGCVCDGCDVQSGQRFEKLVAPGPLLFGSLWETESSNGGADASKWDVPIQTAAGPIRGPRRKGVV